MNFYIPWLRNDRDRIPHMIDDISKTKDRDSIKILVRPCFGLADSLAALNTVLYFALYVSKLNPNQIFFRNKQHYTDLDNFLDFKGINYAKHDRKVNDMKTFDIVIDRGFFDGLYWSHPYHFKNYVSFKSDLVETAKQYKCQYGIHIRNKEAEKSFRSPPNYNAELSAALLIEKIKNKLLINNQNDFYFISCDSPLYKKEHFKDLPNVKMIEKNERCYEVRVDSKLALLDLAVLSQCDVIYRTCISGFSVLATLLSNKELPHCNEVCLKFDGVGKRFKLKELGYINDYLLSND